MASPTTDEDRAATPGPFSMTDEEGDLGKYQRYLRTLTPEALWDVHAHLDAENYPRRAEAIRREMARRRLFYVSPYTVLEARLRCLFGATLLFAVLGALLHHVPALLAGVNRAADEIGGVGGAGMPYGSPRSVTLITGLTVQEARVLATVAGFCRFVAVSGLLASLPALVLCAARLFRRRLRPDVFVTGLVAGLLSVALLCCSRR